MGETINLDVYRVDRFTFFFIDDLIVPVRLRYIFKNCEYLYKNIVIYTHLIHFFGIKYFDTWKNVDVK